MSSAQGNESCGSGLVRDKFIKLDKRSKRHLSSREEEILLACLKEIVATGWKSDNGFRGGYLNKLEELMKKELPGTDLKGSPNINSKLQFWKKTYNSLTTMLSYSGIGFKDNIIDCTNGQWDAIVKRDANAKGIRGKPYPMYEDWKLIFGKDRATGEHAKDVADAANEAYKEHNRANDEVNADYYYVSTDHLDDNIAMENSVCGSKNGAAKDSVCGGENGETVSKSSGKKRKFKDTSDKLVEVLREMNHSTNVRLDKIASRIGYEFDIDEAKKESYALLKDIPDLSLDEKFQVCEIFASSYDRQLVFKGLPEEARPQYIHFILKTKLA